MRRTEAVNALRDHFANTKPLVINEFQEIVHELVVESDIRTREQLPDDVVRGIIRVCHRLIEQHRRFGGERGLSAWAERVHGLFTLDAVMNS